MASNFVSGFVLLMDKSIKPGDVISFTGQTGASAGNFGWVQELRGRYVVVRDRDGVDTLVPNQNLITSSFINWSYSDQRVRLKLPVTVSYDDDPELALKLLVQATENHPRILHDPAPVSRLISFEANGMRARDPLLDRRSGQWREQRALGCEPRHLAHLPRARRDACPVPQQETRLLDARAPATAAAGAGTAGARSTGRLSRYRAVPLAIAPQVEIPDRDLTLTFVRGSGPGGQNVNKLATAAQLRFDSRRQRGARPRGKGAAARAQRPPPHRRG